MNKDFSLQKISIVEDEPLIAIHLASILNELNIKNNVHDPSSNILHEIIQFDPQLVLIDINLNCEHFDGIQLAQQINLSRKTPFVYVTSYFDQNTLQRAKWTEPLAYILKPFSRETIISNLEMASAKILSIQNQSFNPDQPIFIRTDAQLVSVSAGNILYLEAFDNYCFLYTNDNKLLIPKTLKAVESLLANSGLIRIHRSYTVNPLHISSIQDEHIYIDQVRIPIGRQYRKNFFSSLQIL